MRNPILNFSTHYYAAFLCACLTCASWHHIASGQESPQSQEQAHKAEDAVEHLIRGDMAFNSEKYGAALTEYVRSSQAYPRNFPAYLGMAAAQMKLNDKAAALSLAKKSAQICAESPESSFLLGDTYENIGAHAMALACFLKAIEFSPQDPAYTLAAASAYKSSGDPERASAFFRRYIHIAPTGPQNKKVRKYLTETDMPLTKDLTEAPFLLEKRQFRLLDSYLESLLASREKDRDGLSQLENAYDILISPHGVAEANTGNRKKSLSEQKLKLLLAWVQEDPLSHFAHASLGMFYVRYAWQALGTGIITTTVNEGWQVFAQRLAVADKHLDLAYELNPSDPAVPSALISIGTGLRRNKTWVEKQFLKAMKADPTDYEPYYRKLMYLSPLHGGASPDVVAFGVETASRAPHDSLAAMTLIAAHKNVYEASKDPNYYRDPDIWNPVKNTFLKLLEEFPESQELPNRFAYTAYLAQDKDTCRREFERIGDNWKPAVWGDEKTFRMIREEVISWPNHLSHKNKNPE